MSYDGVVTSSEQFHRWFAERGRATDYRVKEVPLDRLTGWHTDPDTGNLVHHTGRFYTVEGVQVSVRDGASWSQPIIVQPEIGILGVLAKEFDGVPHLLMQAKMEPGNINTLQLSPTVQATYSNYTRVHQGNPVPYLEHFTDPRRGRPLADALQSEQGSWFLGKRNRNLIVETTEDVPVRDGFRWISRALLDELLAVDNLVNMDARCVLAALPPAPAFAAPDEDSFAGALARSATAPAHPATLLSRFTALKSRRQLTRRRIPLREVAGWHRTADRVVHDGGRYFSVLGVDVEAGDREVPSWSQPLLAPASRGLIALVTRRVDGVLKVLLQARTEAGTFDTMELGPTVQCAPANYPAGGPPRPAFLDEVLRAPAGHIRFDAVHSEEGGRFHHAENRYLVVEADDAFPVDVPEGYLWATLGEVSELVRHAHYLNVEARSVLTCLHSLRTP
ncbi:NDP-hexose 2,3-dehydratase family protein [Streptomyces sp. NPDC023838]|uniref:NDP-hexose 2,3-dehydratase family protein n=1 Tax=Streptomyces sp. NPDC023838 TaxID=3154325 RepID=UPI0033E7C7CB